MASIMIFFIVCTICATIQVTESLPAFKPVLTRLSTHNLDDKTPSQILITSIAKEDRGQFVKYHLHKALQKYDRIEPLSLAEYAVPSSAKFMDIETPQTFSTDLLKWIKNQFNTTDSELYKMIALSSPICQNGICFDPNDIGEMCCPF